MVEKETPSSSTPALDLGDRQNSANRQEEEEASQPSVRSGGVPGNDQAQDLEKTEDGAKIPGHGFPDGGLTAWLCVVGSFAAFFCSFGWINCIGVFQAYYEENKLKDYSPSTISWILSLETFCMFFFGPVVGKFYDAYGSRFMLLLGTFLHVFGLFMTSISTKYWHFVICQGLVSPTGASLILYPALGDVSTWFFNRRAFALGITASGSSFGGVILPIMIPRLIAKVGFGWAMRATAFLILGLMVIACLTIKSRIPSQGWTGLKLSDFLKHFKEPGFSMSAAAGFMFFFGMFLPFNYIVVSARRNGMSEELANYLVSILNATSVFGRILPGYIADKVGRFNTMVLTTCISGLLVLCLWLPTTSNLSAILFAAFYGFSTGGFVSLAPACLAQISDIREIGVRNGAIFSSISLAALTGVPIGGALVSKYDGGFLGLQVFCGVSLLAGSVLYLVTRGVVGGWKPLSIV